MHLGEEDLGDGATVDLEDPADCGRTFASNGTYGALVFAGVVADRLLA